LKGLFQEHEVVEVKAVVHEGTWVLYACTADWVLLCYGKTFHPSARGRVWWGPG